MLCSIYIITNLINKKVYIGQTWKVIQNRLNEHNRHRNDYKRKSNKLANAINKYGIDKFSISLILFTHTQEIADYWESYFIKKYDSIKLGYNTKEGGSHGKHSIETIEKISNAKTGKKFSEKHKKKLSMSKMGKTPVWLIGNTIWLGKTHSDETRQKLSELGKGRKLSEEIKRKISESRKGQKPSKESISKMIETRKINSQKEGA